MGADRDLRADRGRADQAARRLHDAGIQRRADDPLAGAAAHRAGSLPSLRRRRARGAELGDLCGRHAAVQPCRVRHPLRAAASASAAAVQPAAPRRGCARSRVQHGDQLRHQHQLAVVRAREHDELPGADGRADGAQLRLGGNRHRARHRADPRLRPAFGTNGRQLLGRSRRAARSTCCCRFRSWSGCFSSGRACRRTCTPTSKRRRSRAPNR